MRMKASGLNVYAPTVKSVWFEIACYIYFNIFIDIVLSTLLVQY